MKRDTLAQNIGSERVRIFIIEDNSMVRQSLAWLINHETDLHVCGVADSAQAAIQRIFIENPDIVIMNIHIPDMDGMELIQKLKKSNYDLPILVLTMDEEYAYLEKIIEAGAIGYLNKRHVAHQVIPSIRQIMINRFMVSNHHSEERRVASHA